MIKSEVMAFWTSASRKISAVPVVCVSSLGARTSGLGAGKPVRCGFCAKAVSSGGALSGGVMRVISIGPQQRIPRATEVESLRGGLLRTCYAHAVAPFQCIPHHGPIGDGHKRLGVFFRIGSEGVERQARPAEDEGLEARVGQGGCVRHGAAMGW